MQQTNLFLRYQIKVNKTLEVLRLLGVRMGLVWLINHDDLNIILLMLALVKQ